MGARRVYDRASPHKSAGCKIRMLNGIVKRDNFAKSKRTGGAVGARIFRAPLSERARTKRCVLCLESRAPFIGVFRVSRFQHSKCSQMAGRISVAQSRASSITTKSRRDMFYPAFSPRQHFDGSALKGYYKEIRIACRSKHVTSG